jgi:hypothetical protein
MFDKVKGIFGKKKNMGSGVSGSTDNIANDTRGLDTLNR